MTEDDKNDLLCRRCGKRKRMVQKWGREKIRVGACRKCLSEPYDE